MRATVQGVLRNLLGASQCPPSFPRHDRGMTLTSIITLNAVLGAAVAYGLHHLLAHGIRTHRIELHELAPVRERDPERIAA